MSNAHYLSHDPFFFFVVVVVAKKGSESMICPKRNSRAQQSGTIIVFIRF